LRAERFSSKLERKAPSTSTTRQNEDLDVPQPGKRLFNLDNLSTPVLAAFGRKPCRTPFPNPDQSDSDTDGESDVEALGFPRPAYSRHASKVSGLKKAMLSNMSLADLRLKTKPTLERNSPSTSASSFENRTTNEDYVSSPAGQRYDGSMLGSPIRLHDERRTQSLRSPTPTPETNATNPLTLTELRRLRSTANTTFYDARHSRTPPTTSREVSRSATPLPPPSPLRSETPLKRKPVPAFLETTFPAGDVRLEPSSGYFDSPSTPSTRFVDVTLASEIYVNPQSSRSMATLRLEEASPSSSDTSRSAYSSSTFGSITSSIFSSASSTGSVGGHYRSSLESVQEGFRATEVTPGPVDLRDHGRAMSCMDGSRQRFVLSVDAPPSEERPGEAPSLGRRLVAASMSTPILGSTKSKSTSSSKLSSEGRSPEDGTSRFQFSWKKLRLNR
jgi:hypothetical protein